MRAQISLAMFPLSPRANASYFHIDDVDVTRASVRYVPFSPEVHSMLQVGLLKDPIGVPISPLRFFLVAYQWMGRCHFVRRVSNLAKVNGGGRFVNFFAPLTSSVSQVFLVAMRDLVLECLVIGEFNVCGQSIAIRWKSASLHTNC